ncbi:MAG: hypothetical protein GW911_15745 [Armatimonadetes bacterium]|nr:hypothetical protein [Armatimonadota bacterium]NDK13478.1 hypothetical protein [Armatimonadota bacterium]
MWGSRPGHAEVVAKWKQTAPRCKPRHTKAYEVWRRSAHAGAVVTLRNKQRLVPECLICHGAQFRCAGRFDAAQRPGNAGVQLQHLPRR